MLAKQDRELEQKLQNASWIWAPEAKEVNQYVNFRCPFTVRNDRRISLFISADFGYAAYVNGHLLPASQLTDLPDQKSVDRLDLSQWIVPGENVLAVTAYRQGEDGSIHRSGANGLLFALYAEDQLLACSDEQVLCRLSPDYQSGPTERFSPQLSFTFHCDLTKRDGWMRPSYSCDGRWKPAVLTHAHPFLFPRPIAMPLWEPACPALLKAQGVYAESEKGPVGQRIFRASLSARHPQEMGLPAAQSLLPSAEGLTLKADSGDGIYLLIDLHRETAGLFSLDFSCEEPCEILVGFGEHLEDMRVRADVGGRQFAFSLRAGKGRQQFLYPFKRLGCRYLQLHISARSVTVFEAGLHPVRYPVKEKSAFRCCDRLHNRICAVSRRTLALCMHEHYEDCPWREQALYAMDARSQMLCGYYAYEETDFAAYSLRLFAEGQREDGLLDLVAPAKGTITIPSFSLCYVLAVWEHLLFGGKQETVRELLPHVLRILEVFDSQMQEDGTLSRLTAPRYWNFYEWNPGLDGDHIFRAESVPMRREAPLTAFYLLALQAVQKIFTALEEPEKAVLYRERALRVEKGLQVFWNEKEGAFASFAVEDQAPRFDKLTQSLILLTGACTREQEDLILPKLADRKSSMTDVTLSCRLFLYQALMRRPEVYGQAVADDIAEIWGSMLFSGATSFWETVKGADDFEQGGSLCHGWSAIPLWFYHRWVLGIRPQNQKPEPAPCGILGASLTPPDGETPGC